MNQLKLSTLSFAALLAGLSSIGPFSIDTFLPAMRAIGESLNSTPVAIQQALTLYLFCYGLMMLWYGALSDSFGRRPIILISLIVFFFASIGCQFAQSLNELLIYRAIQGLSGGTGLIIGRAMIRDLFSGIQAQKIMSHVTMMFALSPAIAPIIGGWLFEWFDWRAIFLFMALFAFTLFVLCCIFLPESHAPSKRQAFHFKTLLKNYFAIGQHKGFLFLAFTIAFNFSGTFLYIASAPILLTQHLKLAPTEFIWLFAPLVSGIILGSGLAGKLAGKRSLKTLVIMAYLCMLTSCFLNVFIAATFEPSVPLSVLPITLYTFGMSLLSPSLSIVVLEFFPMLRGTTSSLQGFTQTTLTSLIAGFVAPLLWGSPLNIALGALTCLCVGLSMLVMFHYWQKKQGVTHTIF